MGTNLPLPSPSLVRRLLAAGKPDEALAQARTLADAGHPDGDLVLGWMYQTGVGVPKDDMQAEHHYRLAADGGSALGMFYLGWFYSTNKDLERAVEWFTRSSNSGCSAATYHLGRMFLAGHGVEKNAQTAIRCFDRAAAQGHLYARRNIAHEMLRGHRGILRIPLGLFKVIQVAVAFVRTGLRDADSELLLRV